jgi:hypothetical protein
MSHIIGKVYEVNKENMNKLIAELDEAQSDIRFFKKMTSRLLLALEHIHDEHDVHKSVKTVRDFSYGVINIEEGLLDERFGKGRSSQDESQDRGAGQSEELS